MHRKQQRVCLFDSLTGRAVTGGAACLTGESSQLLSTPGITEDNFMPCSCKNRPELSTHEARPEDTDTHVRPLAAYLRCEFPEPIGSGHAAVHQEVAAGNEGTFRAHQQRSH